MDAISRPSIPSFVSPENSSEALFNRTTIAAASSRRSLDLTITTTEGDTFSLNSSNDVTAGYLTSEGLVTARLSSLTRTDEVSLSFQGDFTKSELRDIARAVHVYGKILKDTLSGRTQPAEAHARELNRLDEISSSSATFKIQQAALEQTQSVASEGGFTA